MGVALHGGSRSSTSPSPARPTSRSPPARGASRGREPSARSPASRRAGAAGRRRGAGAPRSRDLDALPVPDFDDFFDQLRGRAAAARRRAAPARRDRARLLVGRALALHVLRPQRRDDGVPQQVARARARGDRRSSARATASRRSASSTTSSTCATSSTRAADAGRGRPRRSTSSGRSRPTSSRSRSGCCATPGVALVQPGIESLSDHVLALMRKGTTGLQNIQLLKWCKEYGVAAALEPALRLPGRDRGRLRARPPSCIAALWHLDPPTGSARSGSTASAPTTPSPRRSGW